MTLQNAAILVLLYEQEGQDWTILNRRTETVLHHKGQICFPGGACDPGDKSLWETALREGQEEMGLDPGQLTLVKEMPAHITPTGYRVTPFVARLARLADWRPSPDEIAEIFSVPLSHLRDPQNLQFEKKTWEGKIFWNPIFRYQGHQIWGLTGRVLCDLLEIKIPSEKDELV
ncbi:MAG: CoA pyrophosphatase [Deltaproteobacteria bacterium]|nr:CoA pyrophosphatase [Deltaproteobacteria bacterium]